VEPFAPVTVTVCGPSAAAGMVSEEIGAPPVTSTTVGKPVSTVAPSSR
jgi:hypothetical protein